MPTRCWRCDHPIDESDRYCRACGEGQGSALAWYYRPLWIVVLALTVLGPFAIVLIMRTPRLGTGAKWALGFVLVAYSLWLGLALWRDTRVFFDVDVREAITGAPRLAYPATGAASVVDHRRALRYRREPMDASTHGLAIAVHGGAGTAEPATAAARGAAVDDAAAAGFAVLAAGGTSLDAVTIAVTRLEDDPRFNAGLGAVLTEEGTVELDASIMSGADLRAGAVAVVRGVANPILLARAVMDDGRDVFLVGPSAEAVARRHALRVVAPEALITPDALARWRARAPTIGETVGAVARDAHGHVAAGTSTGGVGGQRAGRVGDSAVIGAGTYADDRVGAGSATGPGEAIIRVGLVRTALAAIAAGADANAAATGALATLRERVGANAGIILVDRAGRIGVAYTTPTMPAASRFG